MAVGMEVEREGQTPVPILEVKVEMVAHQAVEVALQVALINCLVRVEMEQEEKYESGHGRR